MKGWMNEICLVVVCKEVYCSLGILYVSDCGYRF